MSDYFMLECLVPVGETILDIRDYPLIDGVDSWLLGSPFPHRLPDPIKLTWDPDTSGVKKYLYDATIPLMRRDLFEALRILGVDNIDGYTTEVSNLSTGAVDHDYVAFNVIGAVQAADLLQSTYLDTSGRGRIDIDFDSLSIHPSKARGLLLFRLAECVSGLVVHQTVKQGLETSGDFGLSFVDPDQWIG